MHYRTLNPTSEELVESFPLHGDEQVEAALDRALGRFGEWSRLALERRAEALAAAASALDDRATSLAELMALEMGKPLAEGQAEIHKCAWGCRYFSENAAGFLQPDPRTSNGSEALVRHDPLGPLLAIMPWNFPFWQFFRFAAPALMAGNVVLLKHAPNTPRCAQAIEALLGETLPLDAVVQNLFLSNEQAARVIADQRIRGVTLTGSARAGSQVAEVAGRNLKKMVMELGGSDPFIVLEDADLEQAVQVGVAARCQNSGQSCIAAKRFLVHRSRFAKFRDAFVAGMQARVVGDPTARGVDVGPLARRDLRDKLTEQVRRSVDAGADVLCGGATPRRAGFFFPPTVLSGIREATPAADEELFGPVASLVPFDGQEQALRIANGTRYGLGASVWTSDRQRAERWIAALDAGSVFVNGLVKSDPRIPFGGVKDSGFGRELGREGMLEFVNIKAAWINSSACQ